MQIMPTNFIFILADDLGWGATGLAFGSVAAVTAQVASTGRAALARVRRQVALLDGARLSVVAYAAQERSAQGEEAARLSSMLEQAAQDLELVAGAREEAQGGGA